MGQIDGFKKFERELPASRDPKQRTKDYKEIYEPFDKEKTNHQAARCMDCGIPFCHSGCPLGNNIPDFNDAVYNQDWEEAIRVLSSTNNFPEFTGRICPAPCEASCVLGINNDPVAIEFLEKTIVETAFEKGLIKIQIPTKRTGERVAVVGSGPAGLAAADQLNKAGHWVTVFERSEKIGGLLRYGIPDFKLEKQVIDRRLKFMEEEGVIFRTNAHVGVNVSPRQLIDDFDAVVLSGGASAPRDLPIPGRNLKDVHFAMEFLSQQNKRVSNETISEQEILATDKHVLVIGGGDTGSDCVGTSHRHGAKSVLQLELLAKPPVNRDEKSPWPRWPMILRTSSSHEEGGEREWSILTKEFIDDGAGNVKGLKVVDIEWVVKEGKAQFVEVAETERVLHCDLALLAIGFVGAEKGTLLDELGVELDQRGNVKTNNYMTTKDGIFSAGDMRRGQSLVVWAISEGREAARAVDVWLMGHSTLESKDESLVSLEQMAT